MLKPKTNAKEKVTTFRLTEEKHAAFSKHCKALGLSISDALNQLIDAELAPKKKPKG